MKLDYLHGTPFHIEQPEHMYHFNSDTELLGKFLEIDSNDTVLDIGTNTGALLLYCALNNPKALCGIDLFEDVVAIAKENMKRNGIDANIYVSKAQDFNQGKYTKIVCNPPYFNDLKDNDLNQYKLAARHQQFLKMDELAESVDRLLDDNGSFQCVYRYDQYEPLLREFEKYSFYPVRVRVVYDKLFGNKKTILLELKKGLQKSVRILPIAYLNDRSTFDKG